MKDNVSVNEATHVRTRTGIHKIASTWGINANGSLAKPSEGGFGVVTDRGERVPMMEALSYLRDVEQDLIYLYQLEAQL